jgi:hypothetical protein
MEGMPVCKSCEIFKQRNQLSHWRTGQDSNPRPPDS